MNNVQETSIEPTEEKLSFADAGGTGDVSGVATVNNDVGYGTGKRKNAISRVWVKPGSGNVVVNNKNLIEYFSRELYVKSIMQVFSDLGFNGQYDIKCTVKGGGTTGQADAIIHGIAKSLLAMLPDLRPTLSSMGYLTRDTRIVERKKYGKHKARKSTQFSKR
ncbi:30S ribosomal protein S9 [Rickettsia endosymbiont of Cardiosporidium cionae]|uniref:30S ribosomal protein S9 n=1 Tax=Rickettsia endosymbiont of Cardiosporidium cionae TaxID=2777155 RepID=UPI0018930E67|nr:30S ribosomal protein S9 [Rickettsia endosymbiont of Cardiosporidium cionae]KAF8818215.1 hypothetical protein IHI24_000672 [Rickettsia endosymbiont of Cardiosporidium cionae]